VSYTAPDTTGQLLLSPVAEMGGWSVVTVTVTEDDGDAITRVFAVSVGDNLQRWQNPFDAKDVNADGAISPIDVLQIVNELNRPNHADQTGRLPNPASPNAPPPYYDVTGDGFVTSRDALLIINCLNEAASGGGEAEGPDDGLSWLAGATGASVNFAVPSVATIPQGSPDNPAVPSNGTGTTSSVVALTKPTTVDAIARHRFFASEEPSPTDDLDSILDTLSADELAKWWS
ncbi:MAG: dockerin type I domain-containing protein, partial [Pirellulaceae bacterium]|nr:dockerin type I domain-containing protein [Pirellulaceae bacterium]